MDVAQRVLLPPRTGRGAPIPWQAKIALKVALARLPFDYRFWRALGVFRHGQTHRNPGQSLERVQQGLSHFAARHVGGVPENALELGPGDSVGAALVAKASGVKRTWMVDVGDFATNDMEAYRALNERLPANSPLVEGDFASRDALLASCGGAYLTGGLASLRAIPSGSIDLVFSTSVLEHVRRDEFDETMRELLRIMRPGAVGAHGVDFMDHLGGGLNNLRFADAEWERPGFADSGFYTNRLRPSEMLGAMARAGFQCSIEWASFWAEPPLARTRMAPQFRAFSDDDLTMALCNLVMIKPAL